MSLTSRVRLMTVVLLRVVRAEMASSGMFIPAIMVVRLAMMPLRS